MANSSNLEARVGLLEQIIIIIIVHGGWTPPGRPGGPPGDSFASDTSRIEALFRTIGRPHGDPPAVDIARLSLQEAEDRANQVAASIGRLQAQHGELQARIKEMRGGSS